MKRLLIIITVTEKSVLKIAAKIPKRVALSKYPIFFLEIAPVMNAPPPAIIPKNGTVKEHISDTTARSNDAIER